MSRTRGIWATSDRWKRSVGVIHYWKPVYHLTPDRGPRYRCACRPFADAPPSLKKHANGWRCLTCRKIAAQDTR